MQNISNPKSDTYIRFADVGQSKPQHPTKESYSLEDLHRRMNPAADRIFTNTPAITNFAL